MQAKADWMYNSIGLFCEQIFMEKLFSKNLKFLVVDLSLFSFREVRGFFYCLQLYLDNFIVSISFTSLLPSEKEVIDD